MHLREHDQSIVILKGVGPKTASLLKSLGIESIWQLIRYFPRAYLDRTHLVSLVRAVTQAKANCIVRVTAHQEIRLRNQNLLKVYVEDDSSGPSATACLVCFGRSYLKSVLLPGKRFLVTGSFRYRYREIQCSNFEYEEYDPSEMDRETILPIYPLTSNLTQKTLRRITRAALESVQGRVEEELPGYLREKHALPTYDEALRRIHFPSDSQILSLARRALVYHELYYLLLTLKRHWLKVRAIQKQRKSIPFAYKTSFLARLPFELTADQRQVLDEIEAELFSPRAMSRLLQGDVGCGKTLVALLSAVSVIEAGEQAALMVPTELLALQHAENAAFLLEPLGIRVALLSGSLKPDRRAPLLEALRSGEVQMVIGTHALFSRDVVYRRLGLVIVDEQHRFGVRQRLALLEKGELADLLLMTATPIPRSLALTAFGDLDISTIRALPPGRRPIITHLTREGNENRVYERVRQEIRRGRQAYFVYPRIEEVDDSKNAGSNGVHADAPLKSVEEMFKILKTQIFPDMRIDLIHSKVEEEQKRRRMGAFAGGELDILVATSVVEVGVDIPNATCMVIEQAERFGLSTLHQLRGRVGRGEHQSYAFLIYGKNLTQNGIQRLKIMMETTDGFRIAEEDLKIRGPGELLGVRQAGYFKLDIADLYRDREILEAALQDVLQLLSDDPGLLKPENICLRDILARVPPFEEQPLEGG
jgi:ATP-dependent DNA helicase RecG